MQLEELIEKSYQLFEKYTIGNSLQVCKICCVSQADETALINTPLRKVSSQLLRNGYFESARDYSDRELWEMKHFLPRVLELVNNFDFPSHSSETVFSRLDLNKTEKWTKEELQLLADFSVLFFRKCLNYYPYSPDGDDIGTYLTMFGVSYFDLKPLLKEWENAENIESILQFKDFVLNNFDDFDSSAYQLTNAFSESFIDKAIANWLNDKTVKEKFLEKIEKLIMYSDLDAKSLEDLSWVYEILK